MRQLLYESLVASAPVAADLQGRIYERSALGVGDIPAQPKTPYLLYGEEDVTVVREIQETAKAQHRSFRFTAYDELGDYLRIERILRNVRDTLLVLSGEISPTGVSCLGAWWMTTSSDGVDSDLNLNFKFAIMRFTTNG